MKKYLLFTLSILFSFQISYAQLANGVTLGDNVTGADVVSGEMIDVQAWLDDGKTVVLDVFATWCGPCWTFHASGWLDEMNERYGPNGTDQIRILGVEADAGSDVELITMQGGTQGTANYSIGDWTTHPEDGAPITYSIIDQPNANGTLDINFFPTLYIIRPDGKLTELVGLGKRFDEEYWIAAMGINPGPNADVSATLPSGSFCDNIVMTPQSVSFQNIGDAPITNAKVAVLGNGELLETVEYTGTEVGIFETAEVQVGAQNFTETTVITASIIETNSVEIESSVESTVTKPELVTNDFTFIFTTDFYPGEQSWLILDDMGNVVASDSYQAGMEDNFGGGGVDALTTHEYQLSTTDDVSCLTVSMIDSYGDGYTAWTPGTHNQPGFAVIDQWGNVVKESSEGFFRFTETEGSINTEMTTSLNDIDELSVIKTYPNPIVDQLNIELGFTENIDFNLSVFDALGNKVMNLGNYSNNYFRNSIDVSNLPTGMYTLSILTDKGQNVSKFVKL